MSHLDLFASLRERSRSIANTLKLYFRNLTGRFWWRTKCKPPTVSEVKPEETNKPAFDDSFTTALQLIAAEPQSYWQKLCLKIPHLDQRIEMIIDTQLIDDALTPLYRAPLAHTSMRSDVRLGLLYLDQLLGAKRVTDFLERKPIALITASTLIVMYNAQWFNEGKAETRDILRLFFNVFVTMEAHFYHPQFTELVQNNESAACRYVFDLMVKEIDICELNQFQRWELITSLKTTVTETVSNVGQL